MLISLNNKSMFVIKFKISVALFRIFVYICAYIMNTNCVRFPKNNKTNSDFVFKKNAITAYLHSRDRTFECQMSPKTNIQLLSAVVAPSFEFKNKFLWIFVNFQENFF